MVHIAYGFFAFSSPLLIRRSIWPLSEIMTQGETIEELEENLRDAYTLMFMEDVPKDYQTKEIVI